MKRIRKKITSWRIDASTWRTRTWPLALGALAVLSHITYIDNGFTWLDHRDIEYGRALVAPLEAWKIVVQRFADTGFYRPTVTLVHSLNAWLFDHQAWAFHATNVLLHALVAVLAYGLMRQLGWLDPPSRVLAAAIIAVHPLSWLPVGAISYRPELLVTLFLLLTLFFYMRARTHGRAEDIVLFVLSFALALGSKETALVWSPALLVLWELHRRRQAVVVLPNGRHLTLFGGGVLVLYLVLHIMAVPELWHAGAANLPLGEALGTRLVVLGLRLTELVSPLLPLLSDAVHVQSVLAPVPLIVLGLVLGGAVYLYRVGPTSIEGILLLWLAVALVPALNLVPLPRFSSRHYGYFAVIPAGWLICLWWHRSRRWKPAFLLLSAMLTVWLGLATYHTLAGGLEFENDYRLFAPQVQRDPNFLEAHYYLGDYFAERGHWPRAEQHYLAALTLPPAMLAYVDRTAAAVNLAGLWIRQNQEARADSLLAALEPHAGPQNLPLIAYNRATIAARRGDFEAVVRLLDHPAFRFNRPEPLLLLAQGLQKTGQVERAFQVLEQALPLLDDNQRARLRAFLEAQRKRTTSRR